MPDFWYKALTGTGAVEEGWINAANEVVVDEELRRKGAFLITAEERTRTKKVTDGSVDRRELLAFLEYLAGAFTAGLPLLTTLDDVQRRLKSTKLREIITEVRHSVSQEGKSLSEALAEHPKAFPAVYISTIQAGEASGQLAFALQQLVEYLDWQENISASVRQATMYPIVVLVAVMLLVIGLIGFVFPRILPILRMRNVELPLPTRIIMTSSLFLREYYLVVMLLLVAAVIAVILLRRNERGRLFMDHVILRIPVLGPLMLEVNMARVVTYLGLFYRTGVDLLQSLLLVENMATNKVVAGVVRSIATPGRSAESARANHNLIMPDVTSFAPGFASLAETDRRRLVLARNRETGPPGSSVQHRRGPATVRGISSFASVGATAAEAGGGKASRTTLEPGDRPLSRPHEFPRGRERGEATYCCLRHSFGIPWSR